MADGQPVSGRERSTGVGPRQPNEHRHPHRRRVMNEHGGAADRIGAVHVQPHNRTDLDSGSRFGVLVADSRATKVVSRRKRAKVCELHAQVSGCESLECGVEPFVSTGGTETLGVRELPQPQAARSKTNAPRHATGMNGAMRLCAPINVHPQASLDFSGSEVRVPPPPATPSRTAPNVPSLEQHGRRRPDAPIGANPYRTSRRRALQKVGKSVSRSNTLSRHDYVFAPVHQRHADDLVRPGLSMDRVPHSRSRSNRPFGPWQSCRGSC
jgi:hypothetical protein